MFFEITSELVTGLDCLANFLCSVGRPRNAIRGSMSALVAFRKDFLVEGLKPSFPSTLSPTLVVYSLGNVKLNYASDLFVNGDCGTRISLTVLPRNVTVACCG